MSWLRRPDADEDLGLVLQAIVLVHGVALAETLTSVVAFGWPPHAGEALLNHLVRAAHIGMHGVLLLLASMLWIRLPGAGAARVRAWGSRAIYELARPWVIFRLGMVFLIALPAFALTVASTFDLAWHVASAMAFALAMLAAALEALIASRRERAPRGMHPLGRTAWLAAAGAIGLLVCPLMLKASATASLTLPLLYVFCPRPKISRRPLPALLVTLALLALAGGLWVDAARPSLRRLSSVYSAYSAVGGWTLRRLTDLDRDGSSSAFGIDCDDLDPERHPKNRDVAGDEVDQNCSGQNTSAKLARARFAPGGPRHPWPHTKGTPTRRPNIYLITIDALRWHELRDGSQMPRTAAWARRCLRFDQARTNSPNTNLALVALHSGMLPRHVMRGHNALFGRVRTPDGMTTIPPMLAGVLRHAGYAAYSVVPAAHYTQALLHEFEANHGGFPRAPEALHAARQMARRAKGKGRPLFLWAHLMEVHAPYPGGLSYAHYQGAVRGLDAPLAKFLGEIGDDAIVVLSADHGEAFGEHGRRFHSTSLFDEELRVPLVLCTPADRPLGKPRRVQTPVGLVDVMPTLLDLVGLGGATAYPLHGESLVTHLREGAPLRSPWVHFVAWSPWARARGLLLGCTKRIEDLDAEWTATFDICKDPSERWDLQLKAPRRAEYLRRTLAEIQDLDIDAYRSWDLKALMPTSP